MGTLRWLMQTIAQQPCLVSEKVWGGGVEQAWKAVIFVANYVAY